MKMSEDPEVTTISEKGRVVISQSIRRELGIKSKTKFSVYGRGDIVIMKKLELPDLKKDREDIFKMMEKKQVKISEKGIEQEIAETRK